MLDGGSLLEARQSQAGIPPWLIWVQCSAFVVLYAVWILPGVVGFRNTALVLGALTGLFPIYHYRTLLIQKCALPIWLMLALFVWATCHLLFLAQDFPAQLLEFKRIWKYAAIGAVFALGLGLSLGNSAQQSSMSPTKAGTQAKPPSRYWLLVYLGLSLPALTYLLKYVLAIMAGDWGLSLPAYLKIYHNSQPFYIPKTDYVAFCLPPLAIALGCLKQMLQAKSPPSKLQWLIGIGSYGGLFATTLFLFHAQNIKNGMAYAAMCVAVLILLVLFQYSQTSVAKRLLLATVILVLTTLVLSPHIQKNDSWKTLIADANVALQTEQYQHWKYAGDQGYPKNTLGQVVSPTNYERVAWLKVGLSLSSQLPLGYGLIEDSFKKLAKARWPEVSPNLSHSHSGWLDIALAIGWPGLALILVALLFLIAQSATVAAPWSQVVCWAPLSILLLWCTTEVSATVTFAALIFWICLCGGLIIRAPKATAKSNICQ